MTEQVVAAAKQAIAAITAALWARLGDLDALLVSLGGSHTRYFVYVFLAVVALMTLSHVLKLSFSLLQKVVLPAAFLAWLAGTFMHVPFMASFLVLVGLGSGWMMFKA